MLCLPLRERRLRPLRLADIQARIRRAVEAGPLGGVIGLPAIARGRDVGRGEIDHHHSAVLRPRRAAHRREHCADDRPAPRAEECEKITGSLARRERRSHRIRRNVAQVHQHPKRFISFTTSTPNGVRP